MEIISLNVGGKKFMTTKQTLTSYSDSYLGVMFSGRFPLSYDGKGRVFIDRDGDLFGHILTFLRSGSDNVGFTTRDLNFHLIINEFQYFGLLHHLILSSSRPFYQSIAPPTSKFSFSKAALLSGHIYLFGVRNGAPLIEIYNPLINRWDTSRTEMFPTKGQYLAISPHIYAYGSNLSELKQFDAKLNKWNTIKMELLNCDDSELGEFSWCCNLENISHYNNSKHNNSNNNQLLQQMAYLMKQERQQTVSIYSIDLKNYKVLQLDNFPLSSGSVGSSGVGAGNGTQQQQQQQQMTMTTLESCCFVNNLLYYLSYNDVNEYSLNAYDVEKRITIKDMINQNLSHRTSNNARSFKLLGHNDEFIYFINQCQSFFGVQRDSKFFCYNIHDNKWVSLPEPKNLKVLHCLMLSNFLFSIGEDYFIEMFDITRNQWFGY